jgi:hypothetical protein
MPAAYPLQLELHADRRITQWRPLVQWLLAIPHLMIAYALRSMRQVLTLISFYHAGDRSAADSPVQAR